MDIYPYDTVMRLRDHMYQPRRGTWFTMTLTSTSSGEISTSFDEDEDEPPLAVWLGPSLEEDLARYPRDEVPVWVQDLLADIRERSARAEARGPLAGADPIPPQGFAKVDRATAAAVASFEPLEAGMRYSKTTNLEPSADQPAVVFRELLEDGHEYRKIEHYADGRIGLAGGFVETEFTWLDEEPVPSLRSLNSVPRLHAVEIAPVDFQNAWLAAGGWLDH
ncbi:DUF6881 domain-containing protein [Nocardia sp. NPDC055321]